MPELWDQLAQQSVEPPSLWPNGDRAPLRITVGGPTLKDGAQAPGYSLDPFNPPQVEYVGRPIAEKLASLFSGPSWLQRATEQSEKDKAAYQEGGVPALMADTAVGQELAGGFGGNTKSVGNAIRAYHGSPHDFDKFDLSKIGTGEGAQVYGHGLYFAENPAVAGDYRSALASGKSSYDGRDYPKNSIRGYALQDFDALGREGSLRNIRDNIKHNEKYNPDTADLYRDAEQFIMNLDPSKMKVDRGKIYEVNINAHPDQFLDWDKPLSQQSPEIMLTFENLPDMLRYRKDQLAQSTGAGAYGSLEAQKYQIGQGRGGGKAEATAALHEAGIPGIKYLDQGSRTAGQGSSNYVVFNDQLIDILKKYGLAGMLGGGTLAPGIFGGEQRQ